jgi:putative ABC transport system permease protein
MAPQVPPAKKAWTFAVDPFDDRLVSDDLRRSIYVAMGAVVLVLLIACANIANLLFARGASRRQEMSVRAALGAGRRRLVAQLLTESLVLCLLGGAAGLAVAAALIRVAVPLLPLAMPFTSPVSLDARVLVFSTALAAITAMAVGVLPALHASSAPLAQALTQGARGASVARERLRRLLVSAEVALSVVLLCGALLLFKSLLNLQRVDLGVEADRVISTTLDLPPAFFPTSTHATTLYDSLVARVSAVPGIVRVSMASHVPLEGAGGENLRVTGRDERVLVRFKRVDPDYFATLTLPVAGRAFNTSDSLGAAPVAIINERLAQRIVDQFGIRNPLGSTVSLPALAYSGSVTRVNMTVVGVAGNERIRTDLRVPMDDAVAYVPLAQAPKRAVTLLVRTSGEPAPMAGAIREAIRQTDNRVVAANMRTMAQIKQRSLSGASEPAFVVGAFATVAVLLAALGLYGVLAHVVAQQRREIGIRMALGATARNVVSQVVTNAMWMIAGGLALGLVASALLTRVTRTLLFEVSALDPAVFISAGAAMLAVGVLASLIPAVRASRVDPTTALRAEG